MDSEMVVDIVITIVGRMSKYLWIPIERQFGYLINYKSNLEMLREKVDKLEVCRNGIQTAIDAATRNGKLIRPDVKDWMTKVHVFKVEALKFLTDNLNLTNRCLNGWFPDLVTRYHIGKEATKKAMAATKLREDGKFDGVSSDAPPPGIQSMSSADFVAYETTKVVFTTLMEALKDENINFIGIYGMGGVGKTTLVKEVGKKAKEEKLFDEVVMAVVSQKVDIRNIQGQLADMLGLKLEEESESGRAGRLLNRIKGVTRILIILDDVWAGFDVASVGIPFVQHKGCKIVITTRRLDVCTTMPIAGQSTKIVHLDVLNDAESWDLFRRNVGEVVDDPTFNNVAWEIARECKGLPVAIVTVGRAMRGKDDPEEWKEAVVELRRSVTEHIEGVEKHVVKCIKLSYDYMQDKEAKFCFLLCSLFPEDKNILIETLVRYAVGLEMIKNVYTVQEVRRRVKSLLRKLRDSCLLIAGKDEYHIKMHDVVRDVALSIGSEEYFVRAGVNLKQWPTEGVSENHTGVSLMENQIGEAPSHFSGKTKLRILLLQGNKDFFLTDTLIEGMKLLRVLDVSAPRYRNRLQNPPNFGYLTCLQTLIVENYEFSSTSFLGQIQTLTVLSLRRCRFSHAPITSLRNLANLKLLDMSYGRDILFEPNIIACLSCLEELYLLGTSNKWEFGNELSSLCCLKVLTVEIPDSEYLPEDFVFPSLENFIIVRDRLLEIEANRNYLDLISSSRGTSWWRNCVKALLKRTEHLHAFELSGVRNFIPNLLANDPRDLDVVKSLEVEFCKELEYLINEQEWVVHHPQALCNLERLNFFSIPSFRGLCNGILPPSVMSLSKLRHLELTFCENILVAISPYSLLERLKELESLQINFCKSLEQLFDLNEVGAKSGHLKLNLLLRNLKVVRLIACHSIKSLFHPVLAQCLQKLEELHIESGSGIREIVANEDEVVVEDKIVFQSLKQIRLYHLGNLDGFCMGAFLFEFPSLEEVDVRYCPKMKTFTPSHDTFTPKLKSVWLNSAKIMLQGMDLNTVLQNHFKAKQEMQTASEGSE